MNMNAITGGIGIGKDTTGNFRASLVGLAVRNEASGRFVALKDGEPIDVTDVVLDGMENLVYRYPVQSVAPGDLIVTSDRPFSALHVQHVDDGTITGINPATSTVVEYVAPKSLLGPRVFVKVVTLLDTSFGMGPDSLNMAHLMPMLLISKTLNSDPDILPMLLMNSGKDMSSILPFLMLKGGGTNVIEALLLMKLGQDGFGDFKQMFSNGNRSKDPEERKTADSAA